MKTEYLLMLRRGDPLSLRQQLSMTVRLSLPAIMAYISSTVMQYIDASMVGRLGLNDSAAIGLVSSSIWLSSWRTMSICRRPLTGTVCS